jgi:glutathione S-transferase
MKLYYHPASTTCRGIMLFAQEEAIAVDWQMIDLFAGQNKTPEFALVNPNMAVPVLEDGDFLLTESSAILKYLADLVQSDAYPTDLRQRARVNSAMDWFNTNFYHAFGYSLVYPQTIAEHALPEPAQQMVLAHGRQYSQAAFAVLDLQIARNGGDFVLGRSISLADYMGASHVTLGELIGFDYSPWPHVSKWLDAMRSRPAWDEVNAAFYGWRSAALAAASADPLLVAIPA